MAAPPSETNAPKFSAEMLRRFTPKYTFNIFNREDIDEITNLSLYISGLVIKDEQMAEEKETDRSLKSADRYIRAVEGTLTKARSFEIHAIIKNYAESNEYYKGLQDLYNIPPYKARKAKDREIITSLNSSALSLADQSLFNKCYYDTLHYYRNVTYTRAFSNQDYNFEFFNWYLVFSAALKFVNAKMEHYFDVDIYDKTKLKNGFISWGLDYFDDFPLVYQKKIYRAINDLIRSKGTNEVFLRIKQLFEFAGLDVHTYHLGKNADQTDLVFYQTPVGKDPDFNKNKKIPYEDLTDPDPYWRADKYDILDTEFNPLATKYISVDAVIDVMENSKKLSYLVTYLNELMVDNKEKTDLGNLRDRNMTKAEVQQKYGIYDESFSFRNSVVSKGKIDIFNTLIALTVLVMKRMNWDDTIHRKLVLPRVYQYNSENLAVIVKKARDNLYWSRKRYKPSVWKEMMDLLNEFKVKTHQNFEDPDLKEVLDMFSSSSVYSRQLTFTAEKANDDVIPLKLREERYYDALEYTTRSLLRNKDGLSLDKLHEYVDLQEVLSKFVDYELSAGNMSKEDFLLSFKNNEFLQDELRRLIKVIDQGTLNRAYAAYLKVPEAAHTIHNVFLHLERALEQAIAQGAYKGRMVLDNYRRLAPFMQIFMSNVGIPKRRIHSIRDFLKGYYYNERLRLRLENAILQAEDPDLYNAFLELWNHSYVAPYKNDMLKGYTTFSEYLLHNDAELYAYVQIPQAADYDYEPDYSKEYRDRIIELTESLSTYLDLKEELFIQNTFLGLTAYIKDYINILITIFKSYTTQTIENDQNFKFAGEFDNYVRVTDSFQMNLSTLSFLDVIEVSESWKKEVAESLPEAVRVTDGLTLTITEGAKAPVVKKYT